MAIDPIAAIETRQLVKVVDRKERPRRALTSMLFPESTYQTLMTEAAQVDELIGEDSLAPFVEVNGEAIYAGQDNGKSYTIETPYIFLKRALTAQRLLMQRQAGQTGVLTTDGRDLAAENMIMQTVKDLDKMERQAAKTEEWMIAQMLTGTIQYQVEGGASFTISTGKPADNDFVAPNGIWTTGSPKVRSDIKECKRLANDNEVSAPTDAIGDSTAADALDSLIESKAVVFDADAQVYNPDTSMIANYEANGMRYIGVIGGVRFWEYNASYTDWDGVTKKTFIRPGYFEFVSLANEALMNRTMFYGRIPDLAAMMDGTDITRRLITTELKTKPSKYMVYLETRPLPWTFRGDEYISMKVTA